MRPYGTEAPPPPTQPPGYNFPFTDLPPPGATTAPGAHAPGPAPAPPTAPRPGAFPRSRLWVLVVVALLLIPVGSALVSRINLVGSFEDQAPAGTGTAEPGPGPGRGGAGEAAPVSPGWAHAGGSGPARYATPPDADLCARVDLAALLRAFGRPVGDPSPNDQQVPGGVSLLCVLPVISEPGRGRMQTVVTQVSATYATDTTTAAHAYDQSWATARDDHAGGQETRDPDNLGESAFGFAAPADGGAAAKYLVSVLDSNLVLTVELRVFAPDPVGSKARSRDLARAFEVARKALARLA
jgi:hypothetical protein